MIQELLEIYGQIHPDRVKVGASIDVKTTVFLRDMADFNSMNEVYRTFFPENPPARSCVVVRGIPGKFPLEIEVIAIK